MENGKLELLPHTEIKAPEPKRLRYLILSELNKWSNSGVIKERIRKRLQVSPLTMKRWLGVTVDENYNVPIDFVIEFAREFNCTVDDLIYKP